MRKRNEKRTEQRPRENEDARVTLSDSLNEDVLAKLKETKKALSIVEQENEEKRQKQLRKERKEREDNKSFEELLNEYGDGGKKY